MTLKYKKNWLLIFLLDACSPALRGEWQSGRQNRERQISNYPYFCQLDARSPALRETDRKGRERRTQKIETDTKDRNRYRTDLIASYEALVAPIGKGAGGSGHTHHRVRASNICWPPNLSYKYCKIYGIGHIYWTPRTNADIKLLLRKSWGMFSIFVGEYMNSF